MAPALSPAASLKVRAAPNGIAFPADYPDWQVVSLSHHVDNQTVRVIVSNRVAIEAARSGTG
jgi:hypothetical protein